MTLWPPHIFHCTSSDAKMLTTQDIRNGCFPKEKHAFFLNIFNAKVVLVVKNPSANAGDIRADSIPGLEKSPGGGHGNPPQYSCLENSRDRGARRVIVHRVAKSQTRLKQLSVTLNPPPHTQGSSILSICKVKL